MAHGNPHEEAEHVQHAAHDPFDRRVAITMVVVAAVLAAVKVVGHRTHNAHLAYQIKAGVAHTQESDQWNFFQSKKMREVLAWLEANLLSQENATTPTSAEKGPASKPALKDEEKRRQALVKDLEEVEDSLKKGPEEAKVGRPEEEADK